LCISQQSPAGDASQLLLQSQVFTVADKYDLPTLKTLRTASSYGRACTEYWDSEPFIAAAEHVVVNTLDTDQGLRKTVHTTLAQYPGLLKKPGVQTLLSKHARFAFNVLKRQGEEMERQAEEIKRLRGSK